MKNLDLENRKEKYLLNTTIIAASNEDKSLIILENIQCKVYLPVKVTDSIALVFHLNKQQYDIVHNRDFWHFSVEGEVNHVPGHETKISAKNVYRGSLKGTHWSPEIIDGVLIAEPVDLKIEHFRGPDGVEIPKTYGRFWLTPNKLISPGQSTSHSFTGEVSIETIWKVDFKLQTGLPITFTNRYLYQDNQKGEIISWSELIAEYELEGKAQNFDEAHSLLSELDDLLAIVSLASRHRCVCLGFDFSNTDGYLVDFYHRNITIPAPETEYYEQLIDKLNIREFLNITYWRFVELERNDLIRQAINYTIPRTGRTIESSFITLYSALETIVLYFRREADLEMVFSENEEEQWKTIQKNLREFFKAHPLLKEDKEKRKRLYDNIPALKRVSFRAAFEACYKSYGVAISDLWPVTDNNGGWSLSTIRNKLVHGEHFISAQRHAVATARSHLQWIVERLLLAILGWDISNSHVSPEYLSGSTVDYKDWASDRKILSS